ncbi:acetyl-CoA C-acetyltransferase [Myxococcaceae bacterium]|jgi:acetyl-CoA C-acetyltransferase|nr:acetyl-CoA C-acetyltransferase [Myxococcaceae bacterium]
MTETEVVIASAARTPIGAFQGALAPLSAPDLGAVAIREAVKRAAIPAEKVERVIFGCVLSGGIGQAPARQATIKAGLPVSAGAVTINKVCGSGLQAVMFARREILVGDAEVIVAGGMESMSNAPYLLPGARNGYRMGNGNLVDSMIHDGLWDPYDNVHMGHCGDLVAQKYGFTREDQDAFAKRSFERAIAAQKAGKFKAEIVPVSVPSRKGDPVVVEDDEGPGKAQLDKISKLKPAFSKEGTVTAANASSINDGAAALVITSAAVAKRNGMPILAKIIVDSSAAVEPKWFTIAPVEALRKLYTKSGTRPSDWDLYEINEAFSGVTMAAMKDHGIDADRVNVHGGAVSLGHPIGCSGARVLVTLLHALKDRGQRRGIATLCIGGGEAVAVGVEVA